MALTDLGAWGNLRRKPDVNGAPNILRVAGLGADHKSYETSMPATVKLDSTLANWGEIRMRYRWK